MQKSNKSTNMTWKKYSKVILSILAFVVNTIGLILSIIGALPNSERSANETFIIVLLIVAEAFLILSAIYSVVSIISNANNRLSVEAKEAELYIHKQAQKVIFENTKMLVTSYKDLDDRLTVLINNYSEELNKLNSLIDKDSSNGNVAEYSAQAKSDIRDNLKSSLISHYNRFMIRTIDSLRDNIEEYLLTKGCKCSVSIAVKQLDRSINYVNIDSLKSKSNVYTAFRDSRTYCSKKRNETWEKCFSISKNSDFVNSIEKDYYIFNFMDKTFMDNQLYLNENQSFYETYNSGVTCTIHSCVNKERMLYGFLACDSLFNNKDLRKCGKDIYDYNVANMMMTTAHMIALYLRRFLEVWDKHYILFDVKDKSKITDEQHKEHNICKAMEESVRRTRYNG